MHGVVLEGSFVFFLKFTAFCVADWLILSLTRVKVERLASCFFIIFSKALLLLVFYPSSFEVRWFGFAVTSIHHIWLQVMLFFTPSAWLYVCESV